MAVSKKPSNLISAINTNLRLSEPTKPTNITPKLEDLFLKDLCQEDLRESYQLEKGEYI